MSSNNISIDTNTQVNMNHDSSSSYAPPTQKTSMNIAPAQLLGNDPMAESQAPSQPENLNLGTPIPSIPSGSMPIQ